MVTRTGTDRGAAQAVAAAFGGGAVIGALSGLIGLGGAEFRLPLLIAFFGFAAVAAPLSVRPRFSGRRGR